MEEDENEEEEEEDEEDEEDEEGEEAESDYEDETARNNCITSTPEASGIVATIVEPSELMQLEMSEDIRVGSPNDGSNNIDSNFHPLAITESDNLLGQADSYRVDLTQKWGPTQDPLGSLQVQLSTSALPPLEEHLTQEDTHYSQTVSSILQRQATRWADSSPSSISCYITCSIQSAFAKWTSQATADHYHHHHTADGSSQCFLKYILFTVPYLHSNKSQEENNSTNPATATGITDRLRSSKGGSGILQDELSANHVLAERRRREKLNERFIILRSLVPFVTKMDKASILGDTIEYVKQLRRKIQDLEARNHQMEAEQQQNSRVTTIMDVHNNNNNNVQRTSSITNSGSSTKEQSGGVVVMVGKDKRKVRILEGNRKAATTTTTMTGETSIGTSVEVSIIESDALLELECSHREGLLLDVMMVLREMRIEVIGVQSSINNGVFVAELRAKVKENFGNGKKVSIVEVKKALNQVIPH